MMQLLNTIFPLLLTSTLVFSAPFAKRDTATVLGDLSTITRNVVYLSRELASFVATPSIGIATFSQHFSQLDKNIDTATADTNAVGSFNATDSEAVANSASGFANDALNLLIALMNNETAIAADGQESLVLGYLNTANTATDSLFTALIDAADENSFDTLSVAQEELASAFQNAITDYS